MDGGGVNPQPSASSTTMNGRPYRIGYLQKQTKDGKWQKRYFETNGNFLTYYESKKMTKLLAAVNLPQVGEIKVIPPDPENDDTRDGGLFTIQLNSRDYTLKAADHEEALGWVEVLRKLKDIDKKDETAGAEGPKKSAATQPTAEVKKESRSGFCGLCRSASSAQLQTEIRNS